MVRNIQYTNINRVLDDLHDEALMEDVTLEQVVRYTLRFIEKNGFSKFYEDKLAKVEINEFRGALPCDLISVKQVKDLCTGLCMRSMTDNFGPKHECVRERRYSEHTFKTRGQVIFTSFPKGEVEIAYKALATDEEGFPMLIDNEVYLSALESFIAMNVIRNKFRQGKVNLAIYQDAQAQYAREARQLNSEFMIPSVSEMQTITNMFNTLIPRNREFDYGFRDNGSRQYLKRH